MIWWTPGYSQAEVGCLSWARSDLNTRLNQEWVYTVLSEIYLLLGYLPTACQQLTCERINQSPAHTFYLRTKLYIKPVKAFNAHYRPVSRRFPPGWWAWHLLFYQCYSGESFGFVPAAALEGEMTTCTSWQIPTSFWIALLHFILQLYQSVTNKENLTQ